MSLNDNIGYIYFVATGLTLGTTNLYLSKPLCLRGQPMSLKDKIRCIWFAAACLKFWAPICICQNHRACVPSPWASMKNLGMDILWPRARHWGAKNYICQNHCACLPSQWASMTKFVVPILWPEALICICQNHCACVPSPWASMKKLVIYILWPCAWQYQVYLFCGRLLDSAEPQFVFVKTTVPACLAH